MPRIQDDTFVTFNDGTLDLCKTRERTIIETKQKGLRFGNQTVGVTRFWNAKVAASAIDRLIAIPLISGITQKDVCIIDGKQYAIKQIQQKFDKTPACLFLSLEENPILYKDVRSGAKEEG